MRLRKRVLPVCGMLIVSCFSNAGCSTTDNTNAVTGGVLGTGLGALTGAIVGSAFGRRDAAAGALIGAAAGGVGGALLGHAQDEKNQQTQAAVQTQYQQAQAAAEARALHNDDIVYMVKTNVSDQLIINSIREREIQRRRRRGHLRDANDAASERDRATAGCRLRSAAWRGCRCPPGLGLGLAVLIHAANSRRSAWSACGGSHPTRQRRLTSRA
jgi:Glycine zipper